MHLERHLGALSIPALPHPTPHGLHSGPPNPVIGNPFMLLGLFRSAAISLALFLLSGNAFAGLTTDLQGLVTQLGAIKGQIAAIQVPSAGACGELKSLNSSIENFTASVNQVNARIPSPLTLTTADLTALDQLSGLARETAADAAYLSQQLRNLDGIVAVFRIPHGPGRHAAPVGRHRHDGQPHPGNGRSHPGDGRQHRSHGRSHPGHPAPAEPEYRPDPVRHADHPEQHGGPERQPVHHCLQPESRATAVGRAVAVLPDGRGQSDPEQHGEPAVHDGKPPRPCCCKGPIPCTPRWSRTAGTSATTSTATP